MQLHAPIVDPGLVVPKYPLPYITAGPPGIGLLAAALRRLFFVIGNLAKFIYRAAETK